MSTNIAVLKMLCDAAIAAPEFQPKNGVTHCNQAVQRIALGYGYTGFESGMLANAMIAFVGGSTDWSDVYDMREASILAQEGNLVIACMPETGHGHVAILYPSPAQFSPSCKCEVPMIANVGKTNGIVRQSQAFPVALFPKVPVYFVLKEKV